MTISESKRFILFVSIGLWQLLVCRMSGDIVCFDLNIVFCAELVLVKKRLRVRKWLVWFSTIAGVKFCSSSFLEWKGQTCVFCSSGQKY